MMKTLYISDLDRTLFNSNTKISDYTSKIINKMIAKGHYFSYATARSISGSQALTSSLNINIPIVAYNGAFLFNPSTKEILVSNFFTKEENLYLMNQFKNYQLTPNVYTFIEGQEKVSILENPADSAQKYYLDTRKNDKRIHIVSSDSELYTGNIFYYLFMGPKEKLDPILEAIYPDERFNCLLSKENDTDYWLEFMPKRTTKANAILQLKELLGCDKIISFGDGLNDIAMFQISDECYAVENAVPELKELSTQVIDSNNHDGVAKWLNTNVL